MKKLLLILATIGFIMTNTAQACTGMEVKTANGNIVNGRTIEFATPITLDKVFVPRNYKFISQLDDKTSGMVYIGKYAFIGGGTYGDTNVADGLNEKGLAIGGFYFPGYAVYTDYKKEKDNTNSLSPTQFTNWILSQFATVDEVKAGIKKVKIVNAVPKGWPFSPPFHYIVYDKTGKSVVIEPLKNGLVAYDNPTNVLTNSPNLEWHLTNLRNYTSLTSLPSKAVKNYGEDMQPFGQGAGLFGLPGDFTPPSRFVRAVVFSKLAVPAPNLNEGIKQMFHLLHQFDIPVGSVSSVENGKIVYDYTIASVVRDPQNIVMYLTTYEDPFTVQILKISDFNLNGDKIITSPINGTVPDFAK